MSDTPKGRPSLDPYVAPWPRIRVIYYAFDLLHLDGQDVSGPPLIERKALLEPLTADKPGLSSTATTPATAN